LESKHDTSLIEENKKTVLQYKGNISSNLLFFPQKGYVDFYVEECTKLVLRIKNHDPWAKNLRIVFHDFVYPDEDFSEQTYQTGTWTY
jgi:hypothetical protein